jgi:hypothetical protein
MLIEQITANQMMLSEGINPVIEYSKEEVESKFNPTALEVWIGLNGEYPNLFRQIKPFVNTYCYCNAYTLDALEDDIIQPYLDAGLNVYSFPRREYLNLSDFLYRSKNTVLETNRHLFDEAILSDLEPLREDLWEYMLKYRSDMPVLCRQMLLFAQLYEKTQEAVFCYQDMRKKMVDDGIDEYVVMDEMSGVLYEYLAEVTLS